MSNLELCVISEKFELGIAISTMRETLDVLGTLRRGKDIDVNEEIQYQIGRLLDNMKLFNEFSTRVLLREEEIEENEDDEGIGEKV